MFKLITLTSGEMDAMERLGENETDRKKRKERHAGNVKNG